MECRKTDDEGVSIDADEIQPLKITDTGEVACDNNIFVIFLVKN